MDMDQAAVFLAGSILGMLGLIAITIGIVVINNIFYKHWKPIKIWHLQTLPPARFATEEELQAIHKEMNRVEPQLEPKK